MKVLFVAINARFVHTNLAVRYLASILEQHDVQVQEYTINHFSHEILEQIYVADADVVAFSCYIWNVELVYKIVSSLKKVNPETVIILGGPEVSYDSTLIMKNNDAIDFIVSGEAESIFPALIDALENNVDYTEIPQLTYRAKGIVYTNVSTVAITHESNIPRVYRNDYVFNPNQIYYYETSRGCPYHCQFCLSGNNTGLMIMPLDHVYQDLMNFIINGVKQVKFVDRTFNVDPVRTLKIWQFIKDHDNGITNFHFEISTASLTGKMIEFLKTVPEGLFQFEIGVQTTNADALKAICRYSNQQDDFTKIALLQQMKSIHLHIDLIAGLPHEDFFSFRQSFNQVFKLETDMLQLGFLKLLKGSGLRKNELEYEYVYQDEPPYEVLSTHKITYGELLRLKRIEHVLEKYWNSGRFTNTIRLAINISLTDPFSFFEGLAEHMKIENPENNKVGQDEQIEYLHRYLKDLLPEKATLMEAVIGFDLAYNGSKKMYGKRQDPKESKMVKEMVHSLLHDENFVSEHFKDMSGQPAKKMLPYIQIINMPVGFNLTGSKQLVYHENNSDFLNVAFIYPRKYERTKYKSNIVRIKGGN